MHDTTKEGNSMDPIEIKRRDFLVATALTGAAAAFVNADQAETRSKNGAITKAALEDLAGAFAETARQNRISEGDAFDASYANMRIFERPIISIGAASDEWFERIREKGIVGEHLLLPHEWLPGAISVISVFSPFTERVRKSNTLSAEYPSREWLHGRIEGQRYIEALSALIRDTIVIKGGRAVSPMLDSRFAFGMTPKKDSEKTPAPALNSFSLKEFYLYGEGEKASIPPFNSNWSERHVAFICGLGTFGRHTCLITPKGTAGRLTSIVTDLPLEPDGRHYADRFEYCFQCGACMRRCPAGAIAESGKDISKCAGQLGKMMKYTSPRYGCGKCQTAVPCETTAKMAQK
jgi:epoxyqueuosine reductase